jgi:hypothetical protein
VLRGTGTSVCNGTQFAATSREQVDRSMANTRFNRAIQLIGVVGALG